MSHPDLCPRSSMEVGGFNLNYEAAGLGLPGPALVLVHGFGASLESWHDVFVPLARAYPTVRIDLLGSGFSDKPSEDRYSPQAQAALLTAFLVKLALPRIVLVGHSLGGGIALLNALAGVDRALPYSVAGLILIDSAGYPQPLPFQVAAIHNPVTRQLALGLPATFTTRIALRRIFYVRESITSDRIHRYAYFARLPGTRRALIKTAHHLATFQVAAYSAQFATLHVPTLVLWGAEDTIIPVQHARRFVADLPGAQLHLLAATGHVPHEERPSEAMAAMRTFLEAVR